MELDVLSISLGILLVVPALIGLFYFIAFLKNLDRYPIPKYLPREDEVLWAMVMSNPRRIWSLKNTIGLRCISWNLGLFTFDLDRAEPRYHTTPVLSDVIVAPKKWGGYHALTITQVLSPEKGKCRLVATYLGAMHNETIKSTRTRVGDAELPQL